MPDLDNTTYEVVRRRLTEQATGLGEAVQALDGERRRLYGATETALLATRRCPDRVNRNPERDRDDSADLVDRRAIQPRFFRDLPIS